MTEPATGSNKRRRRIDIILTVTGLVIAAAGVVVGVVDKKVRCSLHLDKCTTTNGRVNMSPCLEMHTAPDTAAPFEECLPYNLKIDIDCTATGTAVTGPYGDSTIWDHTTYQGKTGYLADAWMYTGHPEAVADPC